jgi:F-type H+-transporting ATPase subunit b
MFTPVLAASIQEMAGKFGLHTDIFIAHFIAFAILVAVVVIFGVKPILKQLEERRTRIAEGEAMHAQSQKELAEVKSTSERILADAHAEGKKEIGHARQTAAKVQADLSEKAAADARAIIENARAQAEMDTQREKDALKGEFARLVAAATAQVTGKVLTEADHRAINEEAIKQL